MVSGVELFQGHPKLHITELFRISWSIEQQLVMPPAAIYLQQAER